MARTNRFAPERHYLPFGEWPGQDQALWEVLVQPGATLLDDSGPFARLAPPTLTMKRVHYSTWLTFIRLRHPELWAEQPPARVTPAIVNEWFAQLGQLVAPCTRLMRAVDLLTVMKAAAPGSDWGWLRRAVNRLRHDAVPCDRKAGRVRSSAALLALGLRLMAEVEAAETPTPAGAMVATRVLVPTTTLPLITSLRAIQYRDGLMIALLAVRPLRLRNLNGLEIGRTLCAAGDSEYRIVFGPTETKTREPIEVGWPADLECQLRRYLARYRPRLLGRGTSPMLWIGRRGKPMANITVRVAIIGRMRDGLGVSINPHLFRDCAATTIAIEDPGHIGIASSLLGHSSTNTTDRHYRQASSINASRRYQAAITELRAQLRPCADCNGPRLRHSRSGGSSCSENAVHKPRVPARYSKPDIRRHGRFGIRLYFPCDNAEYRNQTTAPGP
jgi:integrase